MTGKTDKETTPGNNEQLEQLDELQKMAAAFAEGIETRLADRLDKAIGVINNKIELNAAATAEMTAKAKTALDAVPHLIQEHVENQLQANLKGIVEEVGNQFEKKVEAMAGGGNSGTPGSGMSLRELLSNSDKIIGVINAWKQPTTEQAMLSQMNFVMKWHSLLSKLEKGGGSGDEFTQAIASTFTEKQE